MDDKYFVFKPTPINPPTGEPQFKLEDVSKLSPKPEVEVNVGNVEKIEKARLDIKKIIEGSPKISEFLNRIQLENVRLEEIANNADKYDLETVKKSVYKRISNYALEKVLNNEEIILPVKSWDELTEVFGHTIPKVNYLKSNVWLSRWLPKFKNPEDYASFYVIKEVGKRLGVVKESAIPKIKSQVRVNEVEFADDNKVIEIDGNYAISLGFLVNALREGREAELESAGFSEVISALKRGDYDFVATWIKNNPLKLDDKEIQKVASKKFEIPITIHRLETEHGGVGAFLYGFPWAYGKMTQRTLERQVLFPNIDKVLLADRVIGTALNFGTQALMYNLVGGAIQGAINPILSNSSLIARVSTAFKIPSPVLKSALAKTIDFVATDMLIYTAMAKSVSKDEGQEIMQRQLKLLPLSAFTGALLGTTQALRGLGMGKRALLSLTSGLAMYGYKVVYDQTPPLIALPFALSQAWGVLKPTEIEGLKKLSQASYEILKEKVPDFPVKAEDFTYDIKQTLGYLKDIEYKRLLEFNQEILKGEKGIVKFSLIENAISDITSKAENRDLPLFKSKIALTLTKLADLSGARLINDVETPKVEIFAGLKKGEVKYSDVFANMFSVYRQPQAIYGLYTNVLNIENVAGKTPEVKVPDISIEAKIESELPKDVQLSQNIKESVKVASDIDSIIAELGNESNTKVMKVDVNSTQGIARVIGNDELSGVFEQVKSRIKDGFKKYGIDAIVVKGESDKFYVFLPKDVDLSDVKKLQDIFSPSEYKIEDKTVPISFSVYDNWVNDDMKVAYKLSKDVIGDKVLKDRTKPYDKTLIYSEDGKIRVVDNEKVTEYLFDGNELQNVGDALAVKDVEEVKPQAIQNVLLEIENNYPQKQVIDVVEEKPKKVRQKKIKEPEVKIESGESLEVTVGTPKFIKNEPVQVEDVLGIEKQHLTKVEIESFVRPVEEIKIQPAVQPIPLDNGIFKEGLGYQFNIAQKKTGDVIEVVKPRNLNYGILYEVGKEKPAGFGDVEIKNPFFMTVDEFSKYTENQMKQKAFEIAGKGYDGIAVLSGNKVKSVVRFNDEILKAGSTTINLIHQVEELLKDMQKVISNFEVNEDFLKRQILGYVSYGTKENIIYVGTRKAIKEHLVKDWKGLNILIDPTSLVGFDNGKFYIKSLDIERIKEGLADIVPMVRRLTVNSKYIGKFQNVIVEILDDGFLIDAYTKVGDLNPKTFYVSSKDTKTAIEVPNTFSVLSNVELLEDRIQEFLKAEPKGEDIIGKIRRQDWLLSQLDSIQDPEHTDGIVSLVKFYAGIPFDEIANNFVGVLKKLANSGGAFKHFVKSILGYFGEDVDKYKKLINEMPDNVSIYVRELYKPDLSDFNAVLKENTDYQKLRVLDGRSWEEFEGLTEENFGRRQEYQASIVAFKKIKSYFNKLMKQIQNDNEKALASYNNLKNWFLEFTGKTEEDFNAFIGGDYKRFSPFEIDVFNLMLSKYRTKIKGYEHIRVNPNELAFLLSNIDVNAKKLDIFSPCGGNKNTMILTIQDMIFSKYLDEATRIFEEYKSAYDKLVELGLYGIDGKFTPEKEYLAWRKGVKLSGLKIEGFNKEEIYANDIPAGYFFPIAIKHPELLDELRTIYTSGDTPATIKLSRERFDSLFNTVLALQSNTMAYLKDVLIKRVGVPEEAFVDVEKYYHSFFHDRHISMLSEYAKEIAHPRIEKILQFLSPYETPFLKESHNIPFYSLNFVEQIDHYLLHFARTMAFNSSYAYFDILTKLFEWDRPITIKKGDKTQVKFPKEYTNLRFLLDATIQGKPPAPLPKALTRLRKIYYDTVLLTNFVPAVKNYGQLWLLMNITSPHIVLKGTLKYAKALLKGDNSELSELVRLTRLYGSVGTGTGKYWEAVATPTTLQVDKVIDKLEKFSLPLYLWTNADRGLRNIVGATAYELGTKFGLSYDEIMKLAYALNLNTQFSFSVSGRPLYHYNPVVSTLYSTMAFMKFPLDYFSIFINGLIKRGDWFGLAVLAGGYLLAKKLYDKYGVDLTDVLSPSVGNLRDLAEGRMPVWAVNFVEQMRKTYDTAKLIGSYGKLDSTVISLIGDKMRDVSVKAVPSFFRWSRLLMAWLNPEEMASVYGAQPFYKYILQLFLDIRPFVSMKDEMREVSKMTRLYNARTKKAGEYVRVAYVTGDEKKRDKFMKLAYGEYRAIFSDKDFMKYAVERGLFPDIYVMDSKGKVHLNEAGIWFRFCKYFFRSVGGRGGVINMYGTSPVRRAYRMAGKSPATLYDMSENVFQDQENMFIMMNDDRMPFLRRVLENVK